MALDTIAPLPPKKRGRSSAVKHAPDPRYPSSLLRQTVIATEYRSFDWRTWLDQSDHGGDYAPSSVMDLSSAMMAWDAAASGIGIAMGQTRLLADKIKAGELVTPFHHPVNTGKYYFVFLPKDNVKEGAMLFRNWLLGQI